MNNYTVYFIIGWLLVVNINVSMHKHHFTIVADPVASAFFYCILI